MNNAAWKGHADVAALLLADPRVDPNKKDSVSDGELGTRLLRLHCSAMVCLQDGKTPLMIARDFERAEVIARLEADPRVRHDSE